MAYADYGFDIYSRMRTLLLAGVGRVDIVNRHKLPDDETETEFAYKNKRGIAIRLTADDYNTEGSDSYEERNYFYTLRCFVIDPDEDQAEIIDFAEAVKYTLQQNKNDTSCNRCQLSEVSFLFC